MRILLLKRTSGTSWKTVSCVLKSLFMCSCDGCLEPANEGRTEDTPETRIRELLWSGLGCNVVKELRGRSGRISSIQRCIVTPITRRA